MKKVQLICCIAALSMLVLAGCGEASSSAPESALTSSSSSSIAQESSSSNSVSESSQAISSSSSQADSSASPASESNSAASSSSSQASSATSVVPESSQPASSSTDTGNTGTSAPAVSANKSAKERAEALFATGELEVLDWNIPAIAFGGAMDRVTFLDDDRNIIAFFYPDNMSSMDSDLKANGFYDSLDPTIGWIKAFNDYRGLETDLINNQTLDSSMKNLICYRYDAATDSFTQFLVPVDGDGSSNENASANSSDSSSSENTSANSSHSSAEQDQPSAVAGDVYEAIELINAERVKAGLNELETDSGLMEMAAIRAEEIVENYTHTRPDGSDWKTVFGEYGWGIPNYRGENIYASPKTAKEAVDGWMDSSGHRANILKEGVNKIGVGCYYNSDAKWKYYWVMIVSD